MSQLWKKSEGQSGVHPHIAHYTIGQDPLLDKKILPYDIKASQVHAQMLDKIGILDQFEAQKLIQTFDELMNDALKEKFQIRFEEEDCHTALENALVDLLGDTGKKIHTGRSRNDQVLVALRLYMKDHLTQMVNLLWVLSNVFLEKARAFEHIPLPGYTHTQQAMLSSVGHWLSAHLESLLDDMDLLSSVCDHVDRNPLGSAAGYGVSIDLDRDLTTEKLDFSSLQLNSLYCQNSRGKFEGLYLEACLQIMQSLGRFASDMILFTSQEFDFFEVSDDLVTGSSIMPQKRNLDGLEILRGQVNIVASHKSFVSNLTVGLISGYHRDTQLIKKALFEATECTINSIVTALLYVTHLKPKDESIAEKISSGIFAADIANALVQDQGIPFRDAYRKALDRLPDAAIDYESNIRSKISPGAPGNLDLEFYAERIKAKGASLAEKERDPILPESFSLEEHSCPQCKTSLQKNGWWVTWREQSLIECNECQCLTAFDVQGSILYSAK